MNVIFGADVIRYPLTGIGRYAFEVAAGLARSPEIDSLQYFIGRRLTDRIPVGGTGGLAATKLGRGFRNAVSKSHGLIDLYRAGNSWLQARALRAHSGALFHGPNYYLPPHAGPCVSTFHDLSVFMTPAFHPAGRVRFMAKELPVALGRAQVLIAVSAYARSELIEYSGFPAERVLCVPLAASPEFYPRDRSTCEPVLNRHGLSYQGYVLYAGTIEPRKNLARLLDAYLLLPASLRFAYPLVVAGFQGWESADLHARLQTAQSDGWARYLGFVSSDDLPVLFAAARSFAFPSIYEGFGLPVLEAMASGVPVVCSNATSLPEVAGGHALMCAPEDTEMLAELIERAVEDGDWRASANIGGLLHAKSFSWDKTVSGTLQAYRLAVKL